ncbi:putative septum site-determining protein MinD, partial [Dissostichus eleginoides]
MLGAVTRDRLARDRTQPSIVLARQAKINSGSEESIQCACQRTVKLPSMMDSLDVHSLFAARLWS